MKKAIETILEDIESNWEKRQGWFWRVRNKLVYNFMKWLYDKSIEVIIPDPSIDKEEPFSYFAKPNMQLGMPGEKHATRVDFDGQINTSMAKFIVYTSNPFESLNKRIWNLTKGYLPEINYELEKNQLNYSYRAFQYWLDDERKQVPINFIQIDIKNNLKVPQLVDLFFGFIFSPFKYKVFGLKQPELDKDWTYEFEENASFRDGRLMYISDYTIKPNALYAKIEKDNSNPIEYYEYQEPFRGKDKHIKSDTPCLLQKYHIELVPNEKKTLIFKVPQNPIPREKEDIIKTLRTASIKEYRAKFIEYWENILKECTNIVLPEEKVMNTSRASLIYCFMGQNFHTDGRIEQHVNRFQYNDFWLRDSSFYSKLYCEFNRADISHNLLRHFLTKQKKNGLFQSQKGQLDGWGQSLWAFGEYLKYNPDKDFAITLLPHIEKSIYWIKDTLKNDEWGIMPAVFAADNEMISGRYTGHNFWAWIGLNSAQYIADYLEQEVLQNDIREIKSVFLEHFIPILDKVAEKNNSRIYPGLDTNIGEDWGNLLMIYPQKLLDKEDPKIITTLEDYRTNKMPEGIATWMVFNHHYITERVAQQELILGNENKVLTDFYSMLSHTGACHEGFEHNIKPWGNRHYLIPIRILFLKMDFLNFPPHGWFAVCYNLLLRNMLIREEDDYLHLLSVLSPQWINGPIIISNANTYFGLCDFEFEKSEGYFSFHFRSNFNRREPSKIIIHVPYFAEIETFKCKSDQDFTWKKETRCIELKNLKEFTLKINWEIDDNADITLGSYDEAVNWLKSEYNRRYEQQKQ